MKKVLVSGCFDLMHAGHIAFLKEAADYGQLHVRAGADANIELLKGHRPMFSQDERVYLLNNLKCVHEARVSAGSGMLDFEPDLETLKPDVFIVNEDGHTQGKADLCAKHGVEYKVLSRVPAYDFPARSSTDSKARLELPYRICLAGGWMDQPWVSSVAPGSTIVFQIHPTEEFMDRAGLATSTRRTAQTLWGKRFPSGDSETNARLLFACENPPGTKYISGSQDAIGLMSPGINRLSYDGGFWPAKIDSTEDEEIVAWLQSVVKFVPVSPRPDGYDPLIEKNLTVENVRRLGAAGDLGWESILKKDLVGLGKALDETTESWRALLPHTVSDELMAKRAEISGGKGSCYSGCGGGYLMVISAEDIAGSVPVYIRTSRGTV